MFTIYGDRKSFYQWDINQKLIINSPICSEVHFSNVLSNEALVCVAYKLDGITVVDVPNILLTEPLDIKAYIVAEDEGGCRTCNTGIFEVVKRDKPTDYVYTETEVKSFDALEEKVDTELAEFREQLSSIPKFDIKPVEELPTEDISNTTIYLLKSGLGGSNLYEEYIYIDGSWELLGSAEVDVDLTEYIKNTDLASNTTLGIIKLLSGGGIQVNNDGAIYTYSASDEEILNKLQVGSVLKPMQVDKIVKSGLAHCKEEWTEEEKTNALRLLGALKKDSGDGNYVRAYVVNPNGTQDTRILRTGGYNGENMIDRIPLYIDEDWGAIADESKPYKGTIPVSTPKKDYHAVPKKYVDDLYNYKRLVDITLDDTTGNVSVVKVELPLEDFVKCTDFTIYAEIPTEEVTATNVWIKGYIEDVNGTAYSACVLYNNGNIVNSGQPFRVYSFLKILDGNFLSITSNASDYIGANTASNNVKSVINCPIRYTWDRFPPYFELSIDEHTFPAGTRIVMEGR